ncbi:cupin domain-containing protein [Halomonas sp. HK25]|uniref:cupin domain-containing protein n=1 Tax=Halomonas sp. HK25 TaxID=3394321 RepID=UPI0039FDCA82
MANLFEAIPEALPEELCEEIVSGRAVTVERIVSRGHTSPDTGWYDQPRREWVLVLRGRGVVAFEEGDEVTLGPGDYLTIPAHRRHRVAWTDPNEDTVWLAVHYD